MDGDPFEEIVITATAKSKAYRMFQPYRIRSTLRDLDGDLYRKGDTNEYHLITDAARIESDLDEKGWVIAFAVKEEQLTVITQMHVHFDYDDDPIYSCATHPFEHLEPHATGNTNPSAASAAD